MTRSGRSRLTRMGTNITFKGSFYSNMDLIILDGAPVKIGTRVLCGPRVGLFAATHSTDVDERQGGFERAYPIDIGDDCWIGGGAIINGPTRIGKGCTVAAGAVVSLRLLDSHPFVLPFARRQSLWSHISHHLSAFLYIVLGMAINRLGQQYSILTPKLVCPFRTLSHHHGLR